MKLKSKKRGIEVEGDMCRWLLSFSLFLSVYGIIIIMHFLLTDHNELSTYHIATCMVAFVYIGNFTSKLVFFVLPSHFFA
jgi:hypothetical protein